MYHKLFVVTCSYFKISVVEAKIFSLLEEVSVSIVILKSIIYIIRNTFPVGDGLGIFLGDGWTLVWIKSPVLRSFEEVDLIVARPNKSCVNIIRNPIKPSPDLPWIVAINFSICKPPILIIFEEERFSIIPSEGGINFP